NYVDADPSVSVTVVQTFFERLIDVPKLDGYHVLATIAKLAATHPAQVVDFLLARLRRSASEGWRYDVVTGSVARDLDGTALQGWSGYSEILQSVIALLSTPGIKVD